MRKIHMTQQFFEASSIQGHLFEKTKPVFRYGLGECLYQISDLYRFSFDQEVPYSPTTNSPTEIYTSEI